MACGSVPVTDQQAWYEHMIRQQNGMAAQPSPFTALGFGEPGLAMRAGHISAAGHYGFQPPLQPDQHMADKENDAGDGGAFRNGFHGGGGDVAAASLWAGRGPVAGGSGIGPLGGYLGERKRARDEVVFQEFKRRRLAEPEAPPPPAAPAPAPVPVPSSAPGQLGLSRGMCRANGAAPRCLMRHMI
ncbi:uncharacterized protein LOC119091676 isoform X2 [Pollicipes pollicipes]|uniref:uncharacterized protein LOC119091676 isoform X2 n=1 Tax=Pollicipes pollicipes TaxID=41117 RepID=UPI0018851AFB|nr:uncharacterized protein LOC119091676 isoform X2 [Pollicipes pollicipes]XP_037070387.1 uncharacterized protein LOC119091676 isoform X2 [Pollicipes pollicipes]